MSADAALITGTDFIALPTQDFDRATTFYTQTSD